MTTTTQLPPGGDPPQHSPELLHWLDQVVRCVAQAHDESIVCRHPSDKDHTDHDNGRNRPRDALEVLAGSSNGRVCVRRGRGEHYHLIVCGFEVVPMGRDGCYPGNRSQPSQHPTFAAFAEFFRPQGRLGLRWDPPPNRFGLRRHDLSRAICNFVHVVVLLEGNVEGERLVSWVRDPAAPIPRPWYDDPEAALERFGLRAPAAERSHRHLEIVPRRDGNASDERDANEANADEPERSERSQDLAPRLAASTPKTDEAAPENAPELSDRKVQLDSRRDDHPQEGDT